MVGNRSLSQIALPALLITAALAVEAAPLKMVMQASADLDGDGKQEAITITSTGTSKEPGGYVLRVGKAEASHKWHEPEGFAVVDLDTGNKRREILVRLGGGGSDIPSYHIYSYDGKKLSLLGNLSGSVQFPGNATVLVDAWYGSWMQRDKYVLSSQTGKLTLVPQELHWVNKTVTVHKSFPIYRTRASSEVVANLRLKSKVLLIAVDYSEDRDYEQTWFLIKSESNLLGWAQYKTLAISTDIGGAG